MKYHITDDGPKVCSAQTNESCKYYKEDPTVKHFDNYKDAQHSYNSDLKAKYKPTSTMTRRQEYKSPIALKNRSQLNLLKKLEKTQTLRIEKLLLQKAAPENVAHIKNIIKVRKNA